jgi:hypothetical protein
MIKTLKTRHWDSSMYTFQNANVQNDDGAKDMHEIAGEGWMYICSEG